MLELLKKLDKKDSIDLNKEIKDISLDENNALFISRYIVENSKSIIREAYEVQNIGEEREISENLLFTLEEIKEKRNIEGIEDINLVQLINRGISKAIENIKVEFSLSDLIAETNLIVIEFYNKFFNTIDKKYVFSVFDVYVSIMQLQVQNKKIKEEYYNSMGILLYAMIQKELALKKSLDTILSEKNISKEYYNLLENHYENYEIDLDQDYEKKASEISKEFEFLYNSFLFDYIDSALLIDYLELSGVKSNLKGDEKEIINLLKRISEFEI
ncbi:hypothetical protein [Oceanivirga miroungae]|uniref:Uncharacterized protein n=1 Tax=Oceanivirga miroungae TaxID=1130046 RepID=A0A6I8MCB2_9FUSO|nr:hypothetical protein [Oceanivirga miroungae]VWL84806.1 hypothetical protein OMES3154_00054 [Oceanivirga miroungae]